VTFVVFLILAIAILAAVAVFFVASRQPGASRSQPADALADELALALAKAQEEREYLAERVEHLETIVASQVWDAAARGESVDLPPLRPSESDPPQADLSDSERVQHLANRLRGRS
jgi:hypothetical protein